MTKALGVFGGLTALTGVGFGMAAASQWGDAGLARRGRDALGPAPLGK